MNNDLEKSRIINVNDFIFRQNLDFYPNLNGLTCEDNILILRTNGMVLAKEELTFDLRTLPGEVWLSTPQEFINVVKKNKDCENKLKAYADFLAKYGKLTSIDLSNMQSSNTADENISIKDFLKLETERQMSDLLNLEINSYGLNTNNKTMLESIKLNIASLGQNSFISECINNGSENKEKENNINVSNTQQLPMVRERLLPAKVANSKIGFINIAILLYGMLNIGIILAMTLIK